MQERRTTIRVAHASRAQYCPSTDLTPRDGRLTSLSERGLSLLTREAHEAGEQITVSFSLPGEPSPLTATGIVRWSNAPPPGARWHAAGLSWVPMDDAARSQLHRFLYRYAGTPSAKPRLKPSGRRAKARRLAAAFAAAIAAAVLIALSARVASLQQDKRRLETALVTRDSTILQLGRSNARMSDELRTTKTYLAETSSEVDHLAQQAAALGEQARKFHDDLHRFRNAYQGAEVERGELLQRVLDLQQERDLQAQRSIPTQELMVAIRDAIAVRTSPANRKRFGDKYVAVGDNQGYLVRDGGGTSPKPSTVWVRVHDPEAVK
jgi:hypothetical protein